MDSFCSWGCIICVVLLVVGLVYEVISSINIGRPLSRKEKKRIEEENERARKMLEQEQQERLRQQKIQTKMLEQEQQERLRQQKIQTLRNTLDEIPVFDSDIRLFFCNSYENYHGQNQKFLSRIAELKNNLTSFTELTGDSETEYITSRQAIITKLSNVAESFAKFASLVSAFPDDSRLMDQKKYGSINRGYWELVRSMDKESVDKSIESICTTIEKLPESSYSDIDLEMLLKYVWFYATEKPYSAQDFQKTEKIFYNIYKNGHIDVDIGKLYAMKQMGGENVLRDQVHDLLEMRSYDADKLTILASFLMWINAYKTENMVLQYMLNAGVQMSPKAQERLHSLSISGGTAPDSFDVSSHGEVYYFDVSALAWKDSDYTGLFENLAFQDKMLTYALAVRSDETALIVSQDIKIPHTESVLERLNTVFTEEYGNAVSAKQVSCVALSGSGEEKLNGILATSNECLQMGLFVHLVRIGKKLNIKFYTLFLPNSNDLEAQKQQALSLYNKLSPMVTMWEASLKDSILGLIQQLLNTVPIINPDEIQPKHIDNSPVF